MTRFWTADDHFNHPNIALSCGRSCLKNWMLTPANTWVSPKAAFTCAEIMNEDLIRESNQRVCPEDTVICVGDLLCRGGEKGVKGLHITQAEILARLNGKWVIVEGNHDSRNAVKSVCDFMTVDICKYRVGVQHRPLMDETIFRRWQALPPAERQANPWRDKTSEQARERGFRHAKYCADQFDFMICGHVHTSWKTKKIAGIWHVNVGVDVNRGMPINDVEVVQIFEKAVRG